MTSLAGYLALLALIHRGKTSLAGSAALSIAASITAAIFIVGSMTSLPVRFMTPMLVFVTTASVIATSISI
jgi:hypothetical protein